MRKLLYIYILLLSVSLFSSLSSAQQRTKEELEQLKQEVKELRKQMKLNEEYQELMKQKAKFESRLNSQQEEYEKEKSAIEKQRTQLAIEKIKLEKVDAHQYAEQRLILQQNIDDFNSRIRKNNARGEEIYKAQKKDNERNNKEVLEERARQEEEKHKRSFDFKNKIFNVKEGK